MHFFDLTDVIDSVCHGVLKKFETVPSLHLELGSSLPRIRGDFDYLSDALGQILENALRFTLPDGTVTIVTGATESSVWIEVRDTGIGIEEDELPHIFETFWRNDKAHTTPGFGLGLPIAKRIIAQHNGEISVSSYQGQGTTFRVTLPLN
ncbi:MAG: sensor histidine kinase [Anaerolineae bacterium]